MSISVENLESPVYNDPPPHEGVSLGSGYRYSGQNDGDSGWISLTIPSTIWKQYTNVTVTDGQAGQNSERRRTTAKTVLTQRRAVIKW